MPYDDLKTATATQKQRDLMNLTLLDLRDNQLGFVKSSSKFLKDTVVLVWSNQMSEKAIESQIQKPKMSDKGGFNPLMLLSGSEDQRMLLDAV